VYLQCFYICRHELIFTCELCAKTAHIVRGAEETSFTLLIFCLPTGTNLYLRRPHMLYVELLMQNLYVAASLPVQGMSVLLMCGSCVAAALPVQGTS
jgi:hypothetical protein